MKTNQKGFSVVEILIVVVVIGLLAGVGWCIYQSNNKTDNSTNNLKQMTQDSAGPDANEKVAAAPKLDTSIHEVDIKMQTASDISKLPEFTPASFRAYMLDILQNNKTHRDGADDGTITQYQISRISQVNIVGGLVPVNKNGEGLPGGAPAIWALTPEGTWDQEFLNGAVCTSKNGGLIYEEFVKECYTDPNTDSWVTNPNGSITSLAQ